MTEALKDDRFSNAHRECLRDILLYGEPSTGNTAKLQAVMAELWREAIKTHLPGDDK
jgi:SpoVK/Ycf46/Vps4 family AAA+-type ATPase